MKQPTNQPSIDGIKSRLNTVEEKIIDLKGNSKEFTQNAEKWTKTAKVFKI